MPRVLSFATRAGGPLERLTQERPRLTVDAYPVGGLMLLRCAGQVEGLEAELASAQREVLHAERDAGALTLLVRAEPEEQEAFARIAGARAHVVAPVRLKRGETLVAVLLEDGARPQDVLSQFPDAKLLSTRTPAAPDFPLLLPKLTAKQARALAAAVKAGYYDQPRGATTEQISRKMGVARATFQEHLARAEGQVVRAMLPIVRARAGESRGEALEVYAKFSRELGLFIRMEMRGGAVAGVTLARKVPEKTAGADHPYLARILEHVRTGRGDLSDIPLHLGVSDFDREVLEVMRTIPPGQVMTYGEIARRLGKPGASRAVGGACARNPAVIIVPCHRVVPAAGGLGNYSGEGGPATKRKLLEREGAPVGEGRREGQVQTGGAASTIDEFLSQ